MSNSPVFGSFSKKFRFYCAKKIAKSLGTGVNIEKGARVNDDTVIGNNSGIGRKCVLPKGVTIGSNLMMGPDCVMYTQGHTFNREERNYEGNASQIKPIIIEDNVWIGSRAMIMPGVRIGRGSTVAGGAVVTKNVPDYTMVAGNPAVVKKHLLDS